MYRNLRKEIILFFVLFLAMSSYSQEQTLQRIKTGFERIVRGVQQIGSFADILIRSNLRQTEQLPFISSQQFGEQFEIGSKTLFLSIKNEFGKVSIKTWNSPIVKIDANVSVGGKSREIVDRAIDSFDMGILREGGTIYIEGKISEEGIDYLQCNYDLVLPKFVNVNVENFFGDVLVRDVSGEVKVLCQFGNVDVQNIGGNVSISTQGEFSLLLKKVNGNVALNIIRTKAEIEDVRGDLTLRSLMGDVFLKEILSPNSMIYIDGGIMRYFLGKGQNCRIVGSMVGGDFVSDLPVVRKNIGYFTKVELPGQESSKEVQFCANFASVSIYSGVEVGNEVSGSIAGAKPYTDVTMFEEEVGPEDVLIINNQKGGVHLIGSDMNKITIKISRLVWLSKSEDVPVVMDKIVKDFHRTDNRLYLTVRGMLDDFSAEVADWRADIQVMCPVFLTVNVESAGGESTFESLEKSLRVTQDGGNLTLRNLKGEYYVSMGNGNLYIENTDGIGDVSIKKGLVSGKSISGNFSLNGFQSRVSFEDISARTRVFLQGGEVKVLFFSELVNDLELKCKDGDISIILPSNPDCKIKAIVNNGFIDSIYLLTGSFSRLKQDGEVVLGNGKFNVTLECDNGDIFIGGKSNISGLGGGGLNTEYSSSGGSSLEN